ncbi:hypothetical protein [Clostridium ihumii]|nr:hypothetical protein [Clostridium ihumii]
MNGKADMHICAVITEVLNEVLNEYTKQLKFNMVGEKHMVIKLNLNKYKV